MNNILSFHRHIKIMHRLLIIFPGSLFVGIGVDQVLQWFGHSPLLHKELIPIGLVFILVLYIIPRMITYFISLKKTHKYFPVTNDIVKEHKKFFLVNIEQEIKYLEQAVDFFRDRGMVDDYNLFLQNLKTLKEIKTRIVANEDLQRKHLICLNQVFNRSFLMKRM